MKRYCFDVTNFKDIYVPWWKELWLRMRYPIHTDVDTYRDGTQFITRTLRDSKGKLYVIGQEIKQPELEERQ